MEGCEDGRTYPAGPAPTISLVVSQYQLSLRCFEADIHIHLGFWSIKSRHIVRCVGLLFQVLYDSSGRDACLSSDAIQLRPKEVKIQEGKIQRKRYLESRAVFMNWKPVLDVVGHRGVG